MSKNVGRFFRGNKNGRYAFNKMLSTPMVYFNSYGKDSEELSQEAKVAFDAGVRALEKSSWRRITSFTKVIHENRFTPAINNLGALYYSIGRVSQSVYFWKTIKKESKIFSLQFGNFVLS